LAAITVAVTEPIAVAARWGQVLGVPVRDGSNPALGLEDGEVIFTVADDARREGLVEIAVELPPERRRGREEIELGGVRLRLFSAPGFS
jgi:hypothetical protein